MSADYTAAAADALDAVEERTAVYAEQLAAGVVPAARVHACSVSDALDAAGIALRVREFSPLVAADGVRVAYRAAEAARAAANAMAAAGHARAAEADAEAEEAGALAEAAADAVARAADAAR